eukprot:CAMPEP_0175072826 /NCGR_PEP_ID=MMETSP0052_2-20121109/20155_1 /TAXON_ID=51329 ORGANISM="Polytomella parva, Strain SAG 63-3" /NCGR_SAMPLE_ID=MMETSP0052_2 /ASSEMBLY_ACC=CAM_ASM_000194 /LENGTH=197 /DNA_ID=CAMNT_0016340433 /DNA_START=122 /DNA_END=712 /DNA_ORIENTATION=+
MPGNASNPAANLSSTVSNQSPMRSRAGSGGTGTGGGSGMSGGATVSNNNASHNSSTPSQPVASNSLTLAAALYVSGNWSSQSYQDWRQKRKLSDQQRVFCMAGAGTHSTGIRQGLLSRGWVENDDHNSPFFDFKWAANPLDIKHDLLLPHQIVNHYKNATCITTKLGLANIIRETPWHEASDFKQFYPRAYDLHTDI